MEWQWKDTVLRRRNITEDTAAVALVCRKCQLWETRRNAVPDEGELKSRIVFVGEASGRSEDSEGRPFVGAARARQACPSMELLNCRENHGKSPS